MYFFIYYSSSYVIITVSLCGIYQIRKIYHKYFDKKKIISLYRDPIYEYIQKNTTRFQHVIANNSNSNSLNDNIENVIYIKDEFFYILSNPKNHLEKLWKQRILIENTPRGNIYMYYDIFKQGFAYYSDQTGIPYPILNAVAMRYVTVFHCMDFFFDESSLPAGMTSPLIKIFIEDDDAEKKKKKDKMDSLQINMKNAPFAKFKTYSTENKKTNQVNNVQSSTIYGNGLSRVGAFYTRFFQNKIVSNLKHYLPHFLGKMSIVQSWWNTHVLSFCRRIFYLPEYIPNIEDDVITPLPILEKKDKIINKFIFLGHTNNFNPLQIPVIKKPINNGFNSNYDNMFSKVQNISYKDYKNLEKI